MGNTFEIEVWAFDDDLDQYRYQQFWAGQNIFVGIWNMIKAKREGYGCVTFHWR